MKGKVRPHRLYKKKSGKLYIKKGNKKVIILILLLLYP